MRHIWFFLLSICSVSLFNLAFAEPIPPHVGEWTFTDTAAYFRSASNFINSGTQTTDLPVGGYFSYLSDTVSVSYDILPALRLSTNLSYGYTEASNNISTYTGSGVTEAGASAQYWFRDKRWALVPTIQGAFPFYRNSLTQTDALLGNGTAWGEGGAYGMLYYHPVTIFAYAGYRYQDSGLAGLANFDGGASYRFDRARARAGIRGETTVTQDTNTNIPGLRNIIIGNVENSSMHFYSVNPTFFEGYGELDWLFSRALEAGAGFAQGFYGANAAQGWTVSGMVRFRIPTREASRETISQPEYSEPPPINEPIFQPAGTEEVDPTPQPRRKQKKVKSIDKMLQETEKSLQK